MRRAEARDLPAAGPAQVMDKVWRYVILIFLGLVALGVLNQLIPHAAGQVGVPGEVGGH